MGCKYCDQYPNARKKSADTGQRAVSNKRTKLRDLVLSMCKCGDLETNPRYQGNLKKDAKNQSPRQKDR